MSECECDNWGSVKTHRCVSICLNVNVTTIREALKHTGVFPCLNVNVKIGEVLKHTGVFPCLNVNVTTIRKVLKHTGVFPYV